MEAPRTDFLSAAGQCWKSRRCSRLGAVLFARLTGASADFLVHDGDALLQRIQRDVSLLLGDDERWRQADGGLAAAQHQHAALEAEHVHDAVALLAGDLFGLLVL